MIERQVGESLVALMIALALSLGIVLAALRVVALSGSDYLRTEQHALLQEQADYAFDVLAAALQLAGHVDAARPMPALPARPPQGALRGLDNAMVLAGSDSLGMARPGNSGGSDVLAVRFAGAASGRVRNCAGMPVPEATTAADERGESIFHVGTGPQGEPELRCKYRGDSGWASHAIAAGVESFQLLYGLDTDGDGLPNDFVSASRLLALEDEQSASGASGASGTPGTSGAPGVSPWTRVVAVHIALLLRSPQTVQEAPRQQAIDLFGSAYADLHASDDPGSRLVASQLRPGRLYRHFDAVIFLGNSLLPSP